MSVAEPTLHAPATVRVSPWIGVVVFAALTLVLYGPTLLRLIELWDKDPNYSHGFVVAPIAAYLAYLVYRQHGAPQSGDRRLAILGLSLGIVVHLVAFLINWPPLDFLSLFLVMRAGLTAAGGRVWASHYTFPMLFLFFMFPLPITWTSYAALWLQDIVSRMSYELIQLFVVAGRKGHNITIAGVPEALIVAEECSGLRQIVSFLAFGALLGYLTRRPIVYQILLVLMAIPVAIIANVLRVSLMNLGAAWFGAGWIDGPLHHAPAVFTIPVGLVLYLAVNQLLSAVWSWVQPTTSDAPATPAPTESRPADPDTGRRVLLVAVGLGLGLVLQFVLMSHLHSAGPSSFRDLKGPLASVPMTFAGPKEGNQWTAKDVPDLDKFLAKLPFQVDDLIYRDYTGPGLPWARVYSVYSKIGEDRKHHPEICIRDVSGAPEVLKERDSIPLSATDPTRLAKRFVFEIKPGEFLTVYYWHYTLVPREDTVRSSLQRIHSRIGVVAPSMTVQVYSAATPGPLREAIEKTLLPSIDAAYVARIVPEGTDVGSHRLPVGLIRE